MRSAVNVFPGDLAPIVDTARGYSQGTRDRGVEGGIVTLFIEKTVRLKVVALVVAYHLPLIVDTGGSGESGRTGNAQSGELALVRQERPSHETAVRKRDTIVSGNLAVVVDGVDGRGDGPGNGSFHGLEDAALIDETTGAEVGSHEEACVLWFVPFREELLPPTANNGVMYPTPPAFVARQGSMHLGVGILPAFSITTKPERRDLRNGIF